MSTKELIAKISEKEINHNLDDIYRGRSRANSMNSVSVESGDLDPEKTFSEVFFIFMGSCFPVCLDLLFLNLIETLDIIFIGSLGDSFSLSVFSLASFYLNMTGLIPSMSFPGGIDTLCSGAFGAKDYSLVSTYTTIGIIFNLTYFLLLFIPIAFSAPRFFFLFGQEERFVLAIGEFVKWSISVALFGSIHVVLSRYLQAMRFFNLNMIVTFVSLVLHPLWLYIWMFMFDLKLLGVVLANATSELLSLGLTCSIILYSSTIPKETKPRLTRRVFDLELIGKYTKLALSTFVFYFLEALEFEVMLLISAFLKKAETAANLIVYNFSMLNFMVGDGIGCVACSYVGNCVGKKDASILKKYAYAALLLGLIVGVVIGACCFFLGGYIALLYTYNPEILEELWFLFKLLGVYSVFDTLSVTSGGICEGLGRQNTIATVCFLTMYLFGLPLLIYVVFYLHAGLKGMWMVQTLNCIVLFIVYFMVFLFKSVEDTIADYEIYYNSIKKLDKE